MKTSLVSVSTIRNDVQNDVTTLVTTATRLRTVQNRAVQVRGQEFANYARQLVNVANQEIALTKKSALWLERVNLW